MMKFSDIVCVDACLSPLWNPDMKTNTVGEDPAAGHSVRLQHVNLQLDPHKHSPWPTCDENMRCNCTGVYINIYTLHIYIICIHCVYNVYICVCDRHNMTHQGRQTLQDPSGQSGRAVFPSRDPPAKRPAPP